MDLMSGGVMPGETLTLLLIHPECELGVDRVNEIQWSDPLQAQAGREKEGHMTTRQKIPAMSQARWQMTSWEVNQPLWAFKSAYAIIEDRMKTKSFCSTMQVNPRWNFVTC